jgi:tetratricopeptide (TPR) repeat protein
MVWGNWKARQASSLALSMALAGGVGAVEAQTPEAAPAEHADVERLLKEAVELRRAGKDAEALQLVERARVQSPSSRVRAHLAAAHQALGHWLEAEQLLKELLQMSDDAYVESRAATLKRSYDFVQRHLGRIDVVGQPAQAEVLLSGRRIGVLPLPEPASVEVGSYVLEVQMAGYHPVIRPVSIGAGGFLREAVQLVPAAASPIVARDVSPGLSSSAGPAEVAAGPSWITWTLAGLGTAAATTGAVAWWRRERHVSRWNSSACLAPQLQRGDVCPSERDAALRAEQVAIASGVAAGALLGGAVVSFFLERPSSTTAELSSVRCGVGWASAGCHGSF